MLQMFFGSEEDSTEVDSVDTQYSDCSESFHDFEVTHVRQ